MEGETFVPAPRATRSKRSGTSAALTASVAVASVLAAAVVFMLVFFLVIRPGNRGAAKKTSTAQHHASSASASKKGGHPKSAKKGAHPKAPKPSDVAGVAGVVEDAAVAAIAAGIEEGIVDSIVSSLDDSGVDRLTAGVVVPPAASGSGVRTLPTMGQPHKLHKGRIVLDGPNVSDWVDKMDASSSMVRGPDGVLRPMPDARKPRLGVREQMDAMLGSRANRGAPAVLEGWDRSALVHDTTKVRSRDEMARINRRLAVAAAREKAAYPDGLPALAGTANPYMEDLKARL